MTELATPTPADDLVWEDGAVRLADTLFPASAYVTHANPELSTTRYYNVKIELVRSPDNRLMLLAWQSVDDLRLIERVVEVERFTRDRILILEDGSKIAYRPDGGCGCGAALKTWRPWGDARTVGVPRPQIGMV